MKTRITTLLLAGFCLANVSCSVQEDTLTTEQNAVSVSKEGDKVFDDAEFRKALAEGLAEGLKDIKIDFVTLFKYSDDSELKSESERIFKFALMDLPYEMEMLNKDAAYMLVTVDVAEGRGAVTGMSLLNNQKDKVLMKYIPNADRGYDTVYNIPFHSQIMAGYTLAKEGVNSGDATMLSDYLLTAAKSRETGSFMIISTADNISLYLKS